MMHPITESLLVFLGLLLMIVGLYKGAYQLLRGIRVDCICIRTYMYIQLPSRTHTHARMLSAHVLHSPCVEANHSCV